MLRKMLIYFNFHDIMIHSAVKSYLPYPYHTKYRFIDRRPNRSLKIIYGREQASCL